MRAAAVKVFYVHGNNMVSTKFFSRLVSVLIYCDKFHTDINTDVRGARAHSHTHIQSVHC